MKELKKDELNSIVGGKAALSLKNVQPILKNQDLKIHSGAGPHNYTFIWG